MRLAARGRLGSTARGAAGQASCGRSHRLVARGRRFFLHSCSGIGSETGPDPTDRERSGSKHHLVTEAQGIPLALILTGANRNDVTQLLPSSRPFRPFTANEGGRCQNPSWCKPSVATTTTNIANRCMPPASPRRLPAAASRTAAVMQRPAGSSSAPWRGCTTSDVCAFGSNASRPSTRRS